MKAIRKITSCTYWRLTCALTTLALLSLASLKPRAGQQEDIAVRENPALTRYTVTDLGTLGGTFNVANGVNSRGQAGGGSTLPGDSTAHAFLWQDGIQD